MRSSTERPSVCTVASSFLPNAVTCRWPCKAKPGWNMADSAFPSPTPPAQLAGLGRRSRWGTVGLLGLARASRPSRLTFFKTAWDSRTRPKILAKASFLVANGLAFPLCVAAKAWLGEAAEAELKVWQKQGSTCHLLTWANTQCGPSVFPQPRRPESTGQPPKQPRDRADTSLWICFSQIQNSVSFGCDLPHHLQGLLENSTHLVSPFSRVEPHL